MTRRSQSPAPTIREDQSAKHRSDSRLCCVAISEDRNKLPQPWWALKEKKKIPAPKPATYLRVVRLQLWTLTVRSPETQRTKSDTPQSRSPGRGSWLLSSRCECGCAGRRGRQPLISHSLHPRST